jgi:hypothetical protein
MAVSSPDPPDPAAMRRIAGDCVKLVSEQFGRQLEWSMASLAQLDDVCAALLADGPLTGQRLDLWWKLVGAYTGEVVVRAYGGQWITDERQSGAPAIRALGITGFPFGTAQRVLSGEPGKSLASFARALPVIAEHSRQKKQA